MIATIRNNLGVNFISCSLGILFVFVFHISHADTQEDIASIQAKLESRTPPLKAKSIRPSPIPDLYEVFVNGEILYVDKNFSYVLAGGNIINTSTMQNLTQQSMRQLTSIKFGDLPLQNAIEIKKGSGAYKFAVFSDPDCPFCKSLESELSKADLSDYTAYIFLYPLKDLHPDAVKKSENIWCSKDRAGAWTNYMLNNTQPDKKTCGNPLEANEILARNLGVAGTPTIFLNNGEQTQDTQELLTEIKTKK
jgi:thiol:disulfide interchange protein DsbC